MSSSHASEQGLLELLRNRALTLDEQAMALLRTDAPLSPDAIHDIRVTVKRLRAQWQLMRPLGNDKTPRKADRDLRNAARALSESRDLHIMRQTLLGLRDQCGRQYEQQALETIAGFAFPEGGAEPAPEMHAELAAVFERDRERWASAMPALDDRQVLEKGYGRIYRRTRQLALDVMTSGEPESWHRLRKWVRYLFNQLEPLGALNNVSVGPRDLEKLDKKLGKLHDLQVLIGYLRGLNTSRTQREALATGMQVMHRREAELIERCARTVRHCFSLKPRAFRKELIKAWPAATAE